MVFLQRHNMSQGFTNVNVPIDEPPSKTLTITPHHYIVTFKICCTLSNITPLKVWFLVTLKDCMHVIDLEACSWTCPFMYYCWMCIMTFNRHWILCSSNNNMKRFISIQLSRHDFDNCKSSYHMCNTLNSCLCKCLWWNSLFLLFLNCWLVVVRVIVK